jgi:hypothetical protein
MADAAKPTPFEKFEEATKRIFKVSKRDVEKAELRKKKEREAREAEKKT